jgi:D-alanyl-D-alanine dipeptidase
VFDGFRPLAVQQWLWDDYSAQIRSKNPGFTDDEVGAAVRQFVAFPQADPLAPPPHRTGGAVDVYLIQTSTGKILPMGTEADEIAPASCTRWFEEHPQDPFTTNRRLLFHAMTGAGFTNYLGEWWHFDYGNQRWANVSGASAAVYGAAADPGSA